jgi:hypothetical protein
MVIMAVQPLDASAGLARWIEGGDARRRVIRVDQTLRFASVSDRAPRNIEAGRQSRI